MSNTFRRAGVSAIAAAMVLVSPLSFSVSGVALAEPPENVCCGSVVSKLELDNDGDGSFNKDTDSYLVGAAVELLPVELVDSTVERAVATPVHTNDGGAFELRDVAFGKYIVRVVVPEGYVLAEADSAAGWSRKNPVPDATGGLAPENPELQYAYSPLFDVARGADGAENVAEIPVPMFVPTVGKVFGSIWFETDGDGVREEADATGTVPEVEVQLMRRESAQGPMKPIDEPWAIKKSSTKNGKFTFKHLPVGEYQLLYRYPKGYVFSADGADNHAIKEHNAGRLSEPFQISATSKSVNKGAALTYSFSGDVYFDANTDSKRQVTERGAAKVNAELLEGGKVIASTETDPNGRYFFAGIADGEYQVRVKAPKPWLAASGSQRPSESVTFDVTVVGANVKGIQDVSLQPPQNRSSDPSESLSFIEPPVDTKKTELDFGYGPNQPTEHVAEIATLTALWNLFGGGGDVSEAAFAPNMGLHNTIQSWFRVMLCKLGITSNCA